MAEGFLSFLVYVTKTRIYPQILLCDEILQSKQKKESGHVFSHGIFFLFWYIIVLYDLSHHSLLALLLRQTHKEYGMTIRKRIYGIENEFAVVMQHPDGSWDEVPAGYIKQFLLRDKTSLDPQGSTPRIWHSNGSCSYIDTGEHPEHATPECCLIKDAVLYAKAGELLISRIFSKQTNNGSHIVLFKNNLGCDEKGIVTGHFGCHENYSSDGLDFKQHDIVKAFVPFLITRQIMDGSGWWEPDGTFLFSQRSLAMGLETGFSTTHNRPLISMKDTMSDTGPNRLHLILGDANMLDVACFLKLGTTSLVLSLIKEGCAPVIDYCQSIATMQAIARERDITIPRVELMMQGKKLSAFDVQVLYCEAARQLLSWMMHESEEARAELYHVVDLWEQSLHALYNDDYKWLYGRFDWATKEYLANRLIRQKQISSFSEIRSLRKTVDIVYHNITDTRFQNRIRQQWPEHQLVNDKQIEKACYFPPQGTRARMRGLFIASILDKTKYISSSIDWKYCGNTDLPIDIGMHSLDDVFTSSHKKFNAFLLVSLASAHKMKTSS